MLGLLPFLYGFSSRAAKKGRLIVSRFAFTLLFAALALLAGCTKPLDTTIPSDMAQWDKELAPQLKKLTDEERALVQKYLVRAKLGEVFGGEGVAPGTTLAQALDAQRLWEAEQQAKLAREQALKEKLEKERAEALVELGKAVTATLLAKEERPKNFNVGRYSAQQVFRIGVQNNTDKPIRGVAGELKFIDVFDKEVGAVSFRITEDIAPGLSVTWVGERDFNEFIDTHRAVWNLEEGQYTTRFVPEMVVFKDGAKLSVPR